MNIHIGKEIKKRAQELRIGPTELADAINTSKQNVTNIYARKSIDTEQLTAISKALKRNFFELYTTGIPGGFKEVEEMKKQVLLIKETFKQKEIAYLRKINSLLEKKKK